MTTSIRQNHLELSYKLVFTDLAIDKLVKPIYNPFMIGKTDLIVIFTFSFLLNFYFKIFILHNLWREIKKNLMSGGQKW